MVDSLGLQLQNLHYEVLHLQKEVNKCTNYKVKISTISIPAGESQIFDNVNCLVCFEGEKYAYGVTLRPPVPSVLSPSQFLS